MRTINFENEQVLTLATQSRFVESQNPIWQARVQPIFGHKLPQNELHLLPIDTLVNGVKSDLIGDMVSPNNARIYQIWVGQQHLEIEDIGAILDQGIRIQLWVDQPIENITLFHLYIEKFKNNPNFEIIYSLRMLYHPCEIFNDEVKRGLIQLKIHLHTKKDKFDSWPTIEQMYLRIIWLRQNLPQTKFSFQVFRQDYDFCTKELKKFLVQPNEENYGLYLNSVRPISYFSRWALNKTGSNVGQYLLLTFKYFLMWVHSPSKKSWAAFVNILKLQFVFKSITNIFSFRYYKLVAQRFIGQLWPVKVLLIRARYFIQDKFWNIVCYPLRKIYWFLSFQFQKRIKKTIK